MGEIQFESAKLNFGQNPAEQSPVRDSPGTLSSTTRWSTTFSSKVKLRYAIDIRASCGANLVTLRSNVRPIETHVAQRVVPGLFRTRKRHAHVDFVPGKTLMNQLQKGLYRNVQRFPGGLVFEAHTL